MSLGLVATRILCRQDDIILRHVSVMSNRKHENKGRTLLNVSGKKLLTEVESESTESATHSSSIPSEEQAGSSKDYESKQEKYEHKLKKLWLEKFTWLSYDSGQNVMHCNYAKIITGSMFFV